MESYALTFGIAEYKITIDDTGVTIFGCDCSADMTDENVEKVYWALDAYLISKGKISERWG